MNTAAVDIDTLDGDGNSRHGDARPLRALDPAREPATHPQHRIEPDVQPAAARAAPVLRARLRGH